MMQWQATATFNLTQNVLAHAISGTGLLVTMMGISVYKVLALRQVSRASDTEHLIHNGLFDQIIYKSSSRAKRGRFCRSDAMGDMTCTDCLKSSQHLF
jgi:hypothetical protein